MHRVMHNMSPLLTLKLVRYPGKDNAFICLFIYLSESCAIHSKQRKTKKERLDDKRLLLDKKRCQLGRSSFPFLGHVIDSRVPKRQERVESIKRFPKPKTPKDLERYLCLFLRHVSGKNGFAHITQKHLKAKRI